MKAALPLAIALSALPACGEDPERRGPSPTADPAGGAPAPFAPRSDPEAPAEDRAASEPPLARPVLSEAERRVIEAARARRESDASPAPPETPASRPTDEEARALRDDPAARRDVRERVADPIPDDPGAALAGAGGAAEPDPVPDAPDPGVPAGAETVVRPGVRLAEGLPGLRLLDLAIAPAIKGREPDGASNRFDAMPDRFLCWNVLESQKETVSVTHVWRRAGQVISKVELEVGKSARWRTWSRQRVKPDWTGEWSCEVLAPDGSRLGLAEFRAGT